MHADGVNSPYIFIFKQTDLHVEDDQVSVTRNTSNDVCHTKCKCANRTVDYRPMRVTYRPTAEYNGPMLVWVHKSEREKLRVTVTWPIMV